MSLQDATVIATLVVTDLAHAKAFYGETLGLEELGRLSEEESGTAYQCGGGTYLYIYEREAPAGSTATACAFAVDDVAATVYALRERGGTFEEYDIPEMGLKTVDGIATQGPMQSAFFYDPFGNILAVDNSTRVLESLG